MHYRIIAYYDPATKVLDTSSLFRTLSEGYFLFHGTSQQSLPDIRMHGLDADRRPFLTEDLDCYAAIHLKIFNREAPLRQDHHEARIYLSPDRDSAHGYAQVGSEVIRVMLTRINAMLKSPKLSDTDRACLERIQLKYQPYIANHDPLVLAVRGSVILNRISLHQFDAVISEVDRDFLHRQNVSNVLGILFGERLRVRKVITSDLELPE